MRLAPVGLSSISPLTKYRQYHASKSLVDSGRYDETAVADVDTQSGFMLACRGDSSREGTTVFEL
jgi:hypothetical protein